MIKELWAIVAPSLSDVFTLYGGGSKGGGTSTVTNTQQLPAYAQPYAEQLMSRSAAMSNKAYTPYQGQRIADLNANQQAGINSTVSQATNGFQGQGDVYNQYQKTVRGDYLDPASNPYLSKTADAIGQAFNNTVGSQNLGLQRSAGAFGNSGLMQKMSGDNSTLASSLNNLYGQNYAQERGNQLNAMSQAGNMQNLGYTDSSKLMGAGDIQRSYLQDLLNQAYGDWQSAQNQDYKNLDVLAKGLAGSVGNAGQSFSSQSNPYQASPFSTYLGAGLSAAGLLSQLSNN